MAWGRGAPRAESSVAALLRPTFSKAAYRRTQLVLSTGSGLSPELFFIRADPWLHSSCFVLSVASLIPILGFTVESRAQTENSPRRFRV